MKLVNLQCVYEVPDEYKFLAFNQEGVLCGFRNAPIRDYKRGQWVDSVTNDTGEMLLYAKWDQSCREVAQLSDRRYASPPARRAKEKAEKIARKLKGEEP